MNTQTTSDAIKAVADQLASNAYTSYRSVPSGSGRGKGSATYSNISKIDASLTTDEGIARFITEVFRPALDNVLRNSNTVMTASAFIVTARHDSNDNLQVVIDAEPRK